MAQRRYGRTPFTPVIARSEAACVLRFAARNVKTIGVRGALRTAAFISQPELAVPMQIDEATVRHIARLARIKIGKKEAANLERELSAILDWVDQLGEVDTENVAPLTRIGDMTLPWRVDDVTAGGNPEDILRNAPLTEDGFFVVLKVVE